MTTAGFSRSIRSVVCATSSASTWAVAIGRLSCAAMRLHLSSVRLARTISENTSGTWAHLCVTTCPTPPAPMINTFAMSTLSASILFVVRVAAEARAERLEHRLALHHRDTAGTHRLLRGAAEPLEQLLRLVFDVAQHVGDAVAAHLAQEVECAVLVDA